MSTANAINEMVQLRIAAQLAPRRWRRELEQLGSDIENGRDWSTAIAAIIQRQPELGHLLSAALAAGHPASITMKLIQQRAISRVSWQGLLSSLAYPLVLLAIALLVGSLMSMSMMAMVVNIWDETAKDSLPLNDQVIKRAHEFYDATMGGLFLLGWLLTLAILAYCIATPNAWLKLAGSVPVFGRPYRWLHLSELLTRISIFSQFQPSLAKSLTLTAQSYGQQASAAIGMYLVKAIEQGEALPNAIHKTVISDSRAGVALTLIDPNELSGSTMRASQLIDEMVLATCNQLRSILPVFIMLLVAGIIWGTWCTYFELLAAFRELFYW